MSARAIPNPIMHFRNWWNACKASRSPQFAMLITYGSARASGDSLEDEAKMGGRVATLELEVYRLHREWWPAEPQTQKP